MTAPPPRDDRRVEPRVAERPDMRADRRTGRRVVEAERRVPLGVRGDPLLPPRLGKPVVVEGCTDREAEAGRRPVRAGARVHARRQRARYCGGGDRRPARTARQMRPHAEETRSTIGTKTIQANAAAKTAIHRPRTRMRRIIHERQSRVSQARLHLAPDVEELPRRTGRGSATGRLRRVQNPCTCGEPSTRRRFGCTSSG